MAWLGSKTNHLSISMAQELKNWIAFIETSQDVVQCPSKARLSKHIWGHPEACSECGGEQLVRRYSFEEVGERVYQEMPKLLRKLMEASEVEPGEGA